ncbi:hypothetical protein W04_0429 [Pseudoalteromonas sp. SW0106-04]|uniref:hypothetical protein n=1 Tax=Pseudoalteromonas sp. SW0106-04 TaxID=1702169 RepID=UPI0006B5D1FD|nr:hypothetical protein [Pseudoalteromonas sp. SW0106-04]GAP73918.1 hypothetical protein W04_0429 [Pseudoalteromonas sp. SW0106-04]
MTSKPYLHIMKCLFLGGLLAICAFFEISQAYAYGWKDVNRARSGWVLARGLVLEEGHPVYVEYDEAGNLAGGFSMSAAELPEGYVLSAQQVRATYELLNVIKAQSPQSIILSAEQYREKEFKTALDTTLAKVYLPSHIKSVVIRDPSTLLSSSQAHILLQARFDLNSVSAPSSGIRSLLLDGRGAVVHESANNISFKAAFYDGEGGEQLLPPSLKDLNGVKTYAPFVGAGVEVVAPLGGHAATNAEGRWVSQYRLIPCPMFHFEYSTPAIMKYYYGAYNPRGSGAGFDYQIKPGYDVCVGYDALQATDLVGLMVKANIIGILASLSEPVKKPTNFYVDTNLITGGAFVTNDGSPLPIGDSTRYSYQQPEQAPIAFPNVDFDGDLSFEHFVLGDIDEQGNFFCVQQSAEGKYVGVYFSSNYSQLPALDCTDSENEEVQPDAVRVADTLIDMQPQGLLEKITEVDLQDTDILVFRESTGMLVTQRKGLSQQDGLSRYGVEENVFMYQLFMRGPAASAFSPSGRSQGEAGFARYQGESHMNPELHRREADHLRPHERLKIVLINRKTGYIGTAVKTFADIASMQHAADFVSRIAMYPPNLQLTAERFYQADEYTANPGEKQHIISYEGSATGADDMIVVTTQWLDHDGTPLPDGLAEYGYTGRLSAVKGPNNLVTVGGNMANFAIRPGRNVVQIRLPQQANRNEHFYIHVSGEPITESPSFATIGAADEGPLKYRPAHYVPIKVPVFDELQTNQQWYAYKKLQANGEANNIPKPKPVYRYLYRPEYQFSTYELDVQNIIRENSKGESINLFPQSRPLIGSSDNMVALLYKVIASQSDALQFLGQGQELVFALGADEIKATIGENGQVIFKRLDHIAALDVEDFVTLSLYNNTDPTNVLWEYAFESIAINSRWVGYDDVGEDGTVYVSADNPVVPMHAFVPGYASRQNKRPLNIEWATEGGGAIVTNISNDNIINGVTNADIELPPITGARTRPYVFMRNDVSNTVNFDNIEVIPGVPANLAVTQRGKAYIEGVEGIDVQVEAFDAHGNAVADGTSVDFSLDGHGKLVNALSGTQGGRATATVKGHSFPDDDLQLTVTVGDVSQTIDLIVRPLHVEIEDYPTEIAANESHSVRVKVTKEGGEAVSGVPVVFHSSGGAFTRSQAPTNGQGIAQVDLHTGFYSLDNLQITARVGFVRGDVVQGKVTANAPTNLSMQQQIGDQPTTQSGDFTKANYQTQAGTQDTHLSADSRKIMLVGDEQENGTAEHLRQDGLTMGIPYRAKASMPISGAAGSKQRIVLGTLAEPNIQPVAAFLMDTLDEEQARDINGQHHGVARHIKLHHEHPTSVGQSYYFSKQGALNPRDEWESSRITIPASEQLRPHSSVGFRLDMKPELYGGKVLDLEGGVQHLTLNTNGSLTYTVFTEQGKLSVTSNPVALNQWHTVAGRYKNGVLMLEAAGQLYQQDGGGELTYSVTQRGFTIGENYTGYLSSVKLYDYNAAPLLTFSDGSTEKEISFSAAQTEHNVEIVSSGQLNSAQQQAAFLRIGLNVGGQLHYASVLAKQYYVQMANLYMRIAKPQGYPEYAANYKPYTPFPLIPVAHAGFFDWVMDNAYEILVEAVGMLIPYEAGIEFVKQVYYLASGDDDFDAAELVLNGLEVITVIPLAKPLLPVVRTLKAVLRPLKRANPKFMKSVGGVIGKVADEALDKRFDTLVNLLPFLVIAGEMAFDSESRQSLMLVIKTVSSTDDLLTWVEYLNLPVDGWDGESEPPNVEIGYQPAAQQSPQWGFIGSAYAARKPGGFKSVTSKQFAQMINKLGKLFGKGGEELTRKQRKKLVAGIRGVTEGAKKTNNRSLRKAVHIPQWVALGTIFGKNAVKKFNERAKNLRVSPIAVAAAVMYLESRSVENCDPSFGDSCKPLHSDIQEQLPKVYRQAALKFIRKGEDMEMKYFRPSHSGYLFQILVIAAEHLLYEQTGRRRPIAIEHLAEPMLLVKTLDGVRKFQTYQRYVDIVVAGGDEEDVSQKSIFIETKSYSKPKGEVTDYWQTGDLEKNKRGKEAGYTKNHRQFYLDRVAISEGRKLNGESVTPLASNFEWWFQDFKRSFKGSKVTSYDNKDLDKVAEYARKLPRKANNIGAISLGFADAKEHNAAYKTSHARRHLNLFNIKDWLLKKEGQALIENVDPELVKELIEMSPQF